MEIYIYIYNYMLYDVPELYDQCCFLVVLRAPCLSFFLGFSLIALHVQNVFTVICIVERREQVLLSMAIENGEHSCAWEQQD